MSDKKDVYGWEVWRKGKLMSKHSSDIAESAEDGARELQENGVDVSDCLVKPLTPEEEKEYFKALKHLKWLQAPKGFETRLKDRIKASKGSFIVNVIGSFRQWCSKWTDEEVSYLLFWIITFYVLIGVVRYEPRMVEILLWPFMLLK